MFRLFLLLAFFCSPEAATYGKKAPVPKNTPFFVDWVLDGRFWKASSGRFGLALKDTPDAGLGIYRVSKDKIESGRPAQNNDGSLRIKVRESGYALLDFQLGSPADPKDLLFENSCLDSIHQYQNEDRSYQSYFYSEGITSSSKSTLRTLDPKLPVFVKTSLPNCEISAPGFLQTVEVFGGGRGDRIQAPSLSYLLKSDFLLDKPQLRINEDHSYTLAKNSRLTMVWTANPGSYQDLGFFAELVFPDGSIWALSGKKLVASQDVTHTFPLQADWLDSGSGVLRLGLSREGESEPVQEFRIPLTVEQTSGLRLQEQLARLVNQTHQNSSMPLIRFSQAQASTSFVSAPNEFLPGMVDSILLTVSGAGIQTSSMTFSGDTSSARISLGLGTTPTIRLEYLDKSKDIIKIGSRTLSVSLSMPPVVLEPVPGPLPELLVSHPSGYFAEPVQVDFSASGTTIVYTTDQTDPKSSPSAIRVSDFFSLPVSKSATVLAFVEKDSQKSGTRRYVYNLETIPTIEPVILSPERFLNGHFDNELMVLFPAIPDRPLVKLWLNGEEKNLPYSVTISESMTAEYKAISERGFSNTTPDQIELNRVLVYHDVFHTIHTPSVGNLFAGTASVEFLSPETGYRFVYTTDETLPVTGSLEVDLPFTLELNQSTVILGHLIHPSGLKSDLIHKRFTQAPLPDPDTFPRDFVVMEDQSFSVDLLSVGMDEDLMVFVDESPFFGTLELDDTILSYIPDPDYFGPDAFSLEFLHESGLFLQLGFLVEVEGVNDAPVVTGDLNPVTNEDEIVEIDFFAFDPDLDVFNIQISMDPSQGNLFSTTDGRLFYEPAPNYFGQDSFSLTVSDQSTGIQIDFVVTVLPVNDAPILIVEPLSVMEDSSITTQVAGYDIEGDFLEYFLDFPPSNGQAVLLTDGELTYLPDPDFFGIDSFFVTVSDGDLAVTTEVSVTVLSVNDYPKILLYSDADRLIPITSLSPDEDQTATIYFNLFDVDGDFPEFSTAPQPSLSMNISVDYESSTTLGMITIEPVADFFGDINLSLLVCDDSSIEPVNLCTATTVVLTYNPVNDAPVFLENLVLYGVEDSLVTSSIFGFDLEGDSLTYSLVTSPANGLAVVNSDGSLSYMPDSNFYGSDSFVVSVMDSEMASSEATVQVMIEGVDDEPVIEFYEDGFSQILSGTPQFDEDTEARIYFMVGDLDSDAPSISMTPTANTTSVQISVVSTDDWLSGYFSLIPEPDFFGMVTISVEACDTSTAVTVSLCSTAGLDLEFLPVNDAPALTFPFLLTGAEDETVTTQLLYFDIENDSVVFAITTGPVSGMATLSSSGILQYRADSDFFGMDSISVSVTDTGLATGYATISIEILPRNDAPQISYFVDSLLAQAYTTQEFLEDSFEFLYFRFEDLESNPVSITATAILTGMVDFEIFPTTVTTGYILMTPYPEWFGEASLSLEFCDTTTESPGSLCTTSVLNVSFLPVNDAPQLILFSDEQFMNPTSIVSLFEDSTTSIHFVTSDLDMDLVTVTLNTDLPVYGSFLLLESSLSFTPSTNWFGVQTAALQICDVTTIPPGSLCSIETLTFVVEPQNDAPIASFFSDDSRLVSTAGFEFMEDELATIFFSVQDLEGESVSISLMNTLTSGTLAINTTAQTLTISAWPNFFGTDVAVLEFCDQNPATPPSLCSTYNLPILFHPVNDAPGIILISALPITGDEDSSVTFDFVIMDIESSPLSVTLSSAPTKGTVTFPINTSGAGTYVPYPHENGVDSFQLSVSDGELTSQILVSVQINPLPDAPQITWPDVASSIITGSPYPLNPVVLDPDLPADTLSYSWIMTTAPFAGAGEINNPTSTEAMLLVTYPGMYKAELTVTDSFLLSDIETYTFVTKDAWVPTGASIGLPTTPVLLTGSSYGKNLYFGWIGDDSRAEIRIQTASGWGTLSGTMATTIPAMVVRNYEDHVYVAYRDATKNNNISVAYSVGASMSLRRLGESGMAVVTSNAFDMAITRRGTPIVCYAKSLALAKPGCMYYNQYWYPLSETNVLPNFPNITMLKMVLNLDEQPIVIHYDGSAVRAHVFNGNSWVSHGVVYTGADVAQIEASMNGLGTIVLLRLNNGTTKVFVHTAATTWASLEDPDLMDSSHVSLLADGRGSMYIASVQNDGSFRVLRRIGGGWENSMISPPGSFGQAMTLIRKVGQPLLAHHQLNSADPAVVRTLITRLPLIVNATPSLGATRVGTGQNLSLEWNRPLLAGSEDFVGVANKATPHTTLASVVTYSESTMPMTLLDPSSNLAPDSTVLLTVATGINDMQGFGVPTNMVMPFTTRRTTERIADANFTAGEYPGSKDDYSIAIKPSGVGIDSKWVAWNRVSNQNLATKFHTTGSVWVDADSSVTGFGPTGSAYPQIAFFKDEAWLVAKDQNGEMYAMSYNGTVWATSATNIATGSVHQIVHKVGPRINAGNPGQYAMTLRGGTYALQLYKRDAPATTWGLVGGANIYDGISNHYDFTVLPDGKPVIAFATSSAPDQVIVSMFNGTSWVSVVPNLPFGSGHDYTNIRLQNWGNQLSLAAIHVSTGSKILKYNTYNLDIGGPDWNIHNVYQFGVANFDMAIVDAVPYIFAVSHDNPYVPSLVRGGLPHDLFFEFSNDLLPGTGISSVVDGKLAAHRGRLYLIYRDSSTYGLNGWFLEP